MKRSFLFLLAGLLCSFTLTAQRTISGVVTDQAGEPLIGASVVVEGTTIGTFTDIDGSYSLELPAGAQTIVFSYTGFSASALPVGSGDVLNARLAPGIVLEEAVVTALGIERDRKALSYSVEEVGGEDLVRAREENIVNSLAGKVSGVQVTSSSGQVGASARLVVRGNSSFLGNNQPLFVIDGVPVDNSQTFAGGQTDANGGGNGDSPLFFGGTTNRAVDIDPANIESMTVLKGASATALYGSRAANGVVLIETRSGTPNSKPTVRFSTNYGISTARLPALQKEYSQGLNGQYFNGQVAGQQVSTSWGARLDTLRVDANGNYDPTGELAPVYSNARDFFRTGSSFDNTLSIAGGGEAGTYYVSYANKFQQGIVRNNDLDRHSFLAKFQTSLSERLQVAASFNYTNTDLADVTEGNGLQSYLWTVYGAPPSYNLQGDGPEDYLNPDGTQRLYRLNRNNPYFLVDNNGMRSDVNRFLPNIQISYEIAPNLKLTNRAGADIYSDRRSYREVIGTLGTFPTGRVYEDVINYRQYNNDLVLQYNRRFKDFGLDLLLGNQVNERRTDRLFTQGINLSAPDFFNLSNAASLSTVENTEQQRLIGVYGQATVDYRNFLYLTLTARNDWSSTLPVDSRSYFYPSIAGSFVLTEALSSLQNHPVFSFIKFRLGYAEVGNDADPYGTQTDLYVQSSVGDGQRGNIVFPYNGQNGFTISNIIGNPNLQPERTREIEAGIELQFFRNRVRLEGSYYDRLSEDQIFQAPVAGSSGAVARVVNAGSMRNRGLEVLLEVTPLQLGGFSWDIGGTFSRNVNTVESLTEGVENIRLAGFTSPGIYIVRDQGYGVIWGSYYRRNDEGQVIINSDPNSPLYGLPAQVSSDLRVIGNTLPDWFGSLRNTFTFGAESFGTLSLSALLDIRQGGDILNLDNFYLNFYGVTEMTADRSGENSIVYEGVTEDGSPNTIEVPLDETYWRTNWGRAQEEWVEDGSFLRLREVTLSYALPRSLFSDNFFIRDMNIALTGRNLWLHAPNFTGADPEASVYGSANGQGFYNFITPGTVGYNVALNVTF